MRLFLISALLLSLVSGCSSVKLGPHRIDVQQGNALDQENIARLKPGLNRSQVRFLLGTPLIVDPFRTDRWDYVYVFYKAGKLAEQKRITLFFDGETLARIEGDLPVAAPPPVAAVKTDPPAETPAPSSTAEPRPVPAAWVPKAAPLAVATSPAPHAQPQSGPVAAPPAVTEARHEQKPGVASSIVAPLPSPKNLPAYVDPRPQAEFSLRPETDVARIQPEVIPSFPVPSPGPSPAAAIRGEPVLKSLNAWANAWARRDENAYIAAYDASFTPQGGGSRADWERRIRLQFGVSKRIEIKIDSPSINRIEDGTATVTFNQFYRSGSYRDAVVKQLWMLERDGRWLIVEEKVLSILRGAK